jgi:hypothetical protein
MGWVEQPPGHARLPFLVRLRLAEGADQRAGAGEKLGNHLGVGWRDGKARRQAAGGDDGGGAFGIESDEALSWRHDAVLALWQFGGPALPTSLDQVRSRLLP